MDSALLAFIKKYLGQANVGTTPANSGQCVGLVEEWIVANRHSPIWGNAVDLPANADPAHYTVTKNGKTNFPPLGAVVCWDASWGGGYGHTAVVLAATSMQLVVFEQNDPEGAAPLVATHSYGGVAGWITFK